MTSITTRSSSLPCCVASILWTPWSPAWSSATPRATTWVLPGRHGDVLQWWPKHGVTMDQFRQDVAEAMLTDGEHEEEPMTQEQFDRMMDAYLAKRARWSPSDWSARARKWAEESGIVAGDGEGNQRYQSFTTREETVQMLYRLDQIWSGAGGQPEAE